MGLKVAGIGSVAIGGSAVGGGLAPVGGQRGVARSAVGKLPIAGFMRGAVGSSGHGATVQIVPLGFRVATTASTVGASATTVVLTVLVAASPLAPTPGATNDATVTSLSHCATGRSPKPSIGAARSAAVSPQVITASASLPAVNLLVETVIGAGVIKCRPLIFGPTLATLHVEVTCALARALAPVVSVSTAASPQLRTRCRVRRPGIVSDAVAYDTSGGVVGRMGAPGNTRVADPARKGVVTSR